MSSLALHEYETQEILDHIAKHEHESWDARFHAWQRSQGLATGPSPTGNPLVDRMRSVQRSVVVDFGPRKYIDKNGREWTRAIPGRGRY